VSGVGILGGSFNPVHLAHLRAAEEVREAETLDEVRFVPAAFPPHKEAATLVTAAHRRRMVELAIEGIPGFVLSTAELDRPGPSYSVDTLRVLRTELGEATRIVFIIGRDAFAEFESWKEHAAIFELCDVVVMTRPPAPITLTPNDIPLAARDAFWYDSSSGAFRHRSGHVLKLQRITALDISAASIRARVAAGRSIRFLVPSAVERYIAAHGLYRQGDASR